MGPHPLIDERAFVPETIDQAKTLYHALVGAGIPVSQARGVVSWLIVLPDRRADDPASNVTRRDYRVALAKIGTPPWGKDLVRAGASHAKGVLRGSSTERHSGHRFRWPYRRAEALAA